MKLTDFNMHPRHTKCINKLEKYVPYGYLKLSRDRVFTILPNIYEITALFIYPTKQVQSVISMSNFANWPTMYDFERVTFYAISCHLTSSD